MASAGTEHGGKRKMAEDIIVQQLKVGSCVQYERIARCDGSWRKISFPALCSLIQHPERGWILYDTGYSNYFMTETKRFPNRLYRMLIPVSLSREETLDYQLAQKNITKDDIGLIIISHFHCDHIAGLREYTNAQFIALKHDVDYALSRQNKPLRSLAEGFMPCLLPPHLFQHVTIADNKSSIALPGWMRPFETGYDLMEDGSLIAVPLPGHSPGQMGLFLPHTAKGPVFLVADACWSMDACRKQRLPSRIANITMSNPAEYTKTFQKLGELARREKSLWCLPSHCQTTWEEYRHDTE